MKLKIFSSGLSGFFAIFAEHAFDLVGIVADQVVDFNGLDYAGFSPLDKSPDGYAEEVSRLFLGVKIGLAAHQRAPIFFRNFLILWRVRSCGFISGFSLHKTCNWETEIPFPVIVFIKVESCGYVRSSFNRNCRRLCNKTFLSLVLIGESILKGIKTYCQGIFPLLSIFLL